MRLNILLPRACSCKNPGLSLPNALLLGWLLKHICLSLLLVHYPLGTQCFARGPRAEEHGSTWTSVYPSASNFECFASFISTFSVILPFQQALQWQHRSQNEAIQLRSFQKGNLNFNWNSCRKKTSLNSQHKLVNFCFVTGQIILCQHLLPHLRAKLMHFL